MACPSDYGTVGPCGTRGSRGAGPRLAGTVLTISVLLSCSHSIGSPITALMRTFSILCVLPVAGSPSQSSIGPAAVVLVKANCLPSGDQRSAPARAPGGSATLIFLASGSLISVIDV